MNKSQLYSIRMRASNEGKHVSGAERIVLADAIEKTVRELAARSRKNGIQPDSVTIQVESLRNVTPISLTALDVLTVSAPDVKSGRAVAGRVLRSAGVTDQAIEIAVTKLSGGAAPNGGNMRGSMIIDARTGERLEQDQERGIRASRFDWTASGREAADRVLSETGLTHFRTREALALATKVVHAPSVIAELCWSDDPDYTAGYVASLKTGYVRFPFLKQLGDGLGGRALFVLPEQLDMQALQDYLQERVVLISGIGFCADPISADDYFNLKGTRCVGTDISGMPCSKKN